MYTLEELQDIYDGNVGYFTPQEDKEIEVEGTSGPVYGTTEVSSEDVDEALEK